MAITLTDLTQIISQAETEIAEYEAAVAVTAEKRAALTDAQAVVTAAQADLTDAVGTEGTEKADVITQLNAATQKIAEILATLQE